MVSKRKGDVAVVMEVVDYDQLNNDDSIGELIFSMRNVKFSKNPLHWRHLQIPNVKKNFFLPLKDKEIKSLNYILLEKSI